MFLKFFLNLYFPKICPKFIENFSVLQNVFEILL